MTEDLHPNNRLRGYSARGDRGLKRGRTDISLMDEERYQAFRQEIRKDISKLGKSIAQKRFERDILRKVAIARKKSKRRANDNEFNKKESIILDALYPERRRQKRWIPPRRRSGHTKEITLKGLSLIDTPEQTLKLLGDIAEAESRAHSLRINFPDPMCFDMSPYLIFKLMTEAFPPNLLFGGKISDTVRKVLIAVGMSQFMKTPHLTPATQLLRDKLEKDRGTSTTAKDILGEQQENDFFDDGEIMPFSLRMGGGIDAANLAKSEQRDEKVANEFLTTLKKWIARHNPEQIISEDMGKKIKDVMTEIFDNALRHADPETETGTWYTVGVLQKKTNNSGQELVVGNIAILNFGKTIAETLKSAPQSVQDDIQEYVSLHRKDFNEDTLSTLCALQDRVSRIDPNDKANAKLNGVGLMTTIMNVFDPLFSSKLPQFQPSFTLVSGRAWINAQAPYNKPAGKHGTRTLAFNAENDISLPPDRNHVKTLERSFPGTIISIRFVIGADKLEPELSEGTE